MSEQTQPETALQALAEKLRTDAIAIFGDGQAERDIIEWFYGSLLAAAPATPAAQGAVPDVSAMARVLSDRSADACNIDRTDNWAMYGQEYIQDVQAMLAAAAPAQPSAQGEFGDAYQGAREDMAIWKRRALEAEEKVLNQEQIIDRLTLEAQGETRMGEPFIAQGQQSPNYWRDLAVANRKVADNALAELSALKAQQVGQEPVYVECRECSGCGHVGINDSLDTHSACSRCAWIGPSPAEDKCPGCAAENVMSAACPKCGCIYRLLADAEITAPQPAPAQDVTAVLKMARALSDRQADACNVDREDQWKLYSEDFVADVEAMLAAAPAQPAAQSEFGDAYHGAREDLAIWKRRALEAEEKVRNQEQIIDRLTLEAQGESRMGEPDIPAAQEHYPECDYCGVASDHHPWHGSGLLNGEESRHIHACDSCRHLLPAARDQGEAQRLREALERATKLLSAAAGYATKMEPMPAKLLNAIDAELDASAGQEVES